MADNHIESSAFMFAYDTLMKDYRPDLRMMLILKSDDRRITAYAKAERLIISCIWRVLRRQFGERAQLIKSAPYDALRSSMNTERTYMRIENELRAGGLPCPWDTYT